MAAALGVILAVFEAHLGDLAEGEPWRVLDVLAAALTQSDDTS